VSRPTVHSVDVKLKIVLSVLAGESTQSEAARRHGISETSIGKWKQQFLDTAATDRTPSVPSADNPVPRHECQVLRVARWRRATNLGTPFRDAVHLDAGPETTKPPR